VAINSLYMVKTSGFAIKTLYIKMATPPFNENT
jgi:hypothetical protein